MYLIMFLFEPAKLQVKPSTMRKKQASKTLAAKEAESIQTNATQESELPGPSVQPKAFDLTQKGSGDHVDIEKGTLGGVKDPEDSSSGAQTTQTRATSRRNR